MTNPVNDRPHHQVKQLLNERLLPPLTDVAFQYLISYRVDVTSEPSKPGSELVIQQLFNDCLLLSSVTLRSTPHLSVFTGNGDERDQNVLRQIQAHLNSTGEMALSYFKSYAAIYTGAPGVFLNTGKLMETLDKGQPLTAELAEEEIVQEKRNAAYLEVLAGTKDPGCLDY